MNKIIRVLALALAGIKVCVMICSFFVYPLPGFTVSVDGFAEYKIIGGRFAVVTPLRADSFFSKNERKFPRLRYISAYKRKEIKERLDYFIDNADEDDIKNRPMDMRKLIVTIDNNEYVSNLWFSFDLPEYCKDYTYDGAVELWVELTRDDYFLTMEPASVVINYWMWMYGDDCIGVSAEEYINISSAATRGMLNKGELLVDNLIRWYWKSR